MDEAKLTGGSEEDRKEILRLHEKYIDVNTRFDTELHAVRAERRAAQAKP